MIYYSTSIQSFDFMMGDIYNDADHRLYGGSSFGRDFVVKDINGDGTDDIMQ